MLSTRPFGAHHCTQPPRRPSAAPRSLKLGCATPWHHRTCSSPGAMLPTQSPGLSFPTPHGSHHGDHHRGASAMQPTHTPPRDWPPRSSWLDEDVYAAWLVDQASRRSKLKAPFARWRWRSVLLREVEAALPFAADASRRRLRASLRRRAALQLRQCLCKRWRRFALWRSQQVALLREARKRSLRVYLAHWAFRAGQLMHDAARMGRGHTLAWRRALRAWHSVADAAVRGFLRRERLEGRLSASRARRWLAALRRACASSASSRARRVVLSRLTALLQTCAALRRWRRASEAMYWARRRLILRLTAVLSAALHSWVCYARLVMLPHAASHLCVQARYHRGLRQLWRHRRQSSRQVVPQGRTSHVTETPHQTASNRCAALTRAFNRLCLHAYSQPRVSHVAGRY